MSKSKSSHVGFFRVMFHLVFGLLTCGFWWLYLGIRYVLR